MASLIDTDSDLELIRPFADSTVTVVTTMLGSQCELGEIQPVESGHHMNDVTSVIGLTGEMTGSLSFSISREGAIKILELMAGVAAKEVDADVRDAVGEMSNMIAGYGKRHLERLAFDLGLPQVIVGQDYSVYSPRWAKHFWIPVTTDFGSFTIDIGFDPPKC